MDPFVFALAAVAVTALAIVIIVATVLPTLLSKPRFAKAQDIVVDAPPVAVDTVSEDPTGPLLAQIEDLEARNKETEAELGRRRESHEEVVRVLMSERDSWRELHEKLSVAYSEGESFYAERLEEATVALNKEISKKDKEWVMALQKRMAAHLATKTLARSRVKKTEDGTTVLDGAAAPDPVKTYQEQIA